MGVFTIELQDGDGQTDLYSTNPDGEGILFPGNCLYSAEQTFRLLFRNQTAMS